MVTSSPPTSPPGTDKTGMDFRRILPEIRCQSCLSPGSEPTPRGAFSTLSCPLHRVGNGVDGDLHRVIDAEHQGAGVFHAPCYVGHLEGGGNVVLAGGGLHRGGEQDLGLHAVNGETSVQLHLR